MENTHNKELYSLHTPKGGTEKDSLMNSEKKLSEKDSQIEVETDPVENASENASDNHTDKKNNHAHRKDPAQSGQPESSKEDPANPEIPELKEDNANVEASDGKLTTQDPIPEIIKAETLIVEENSKTTEEKQVIDEGVDVHTEAKVELEGNEDIPEEELPKQEEQQKPEEKDNFKSSEESSSIDQKTEDSGSLAVSEKEEAEAEKSVSDKEKVENPVPTGTSGEAAAGKTTDEEAKDKPEIHSKNEEDNDFSVYTAEQIVELVKKLAHYEDVIRAEKILRKLKGRMSKLQKEERSETLKNFLEGGGEEANFSYKASEPFERFDANTKLIQDRKHHYLKDLERRKEENLAKAEVLLERLREFLDGSESTTSFKVFKDIQNEWKGLGPLPGTHYRSLWANYNALVNRFYDTRSIYFELKELDRRKNLEYKLQLCEKAEDLEQVVDLKEAIFQLNELHNEFKHTGPVPISEQEPLWQRFKAASDKVYERRKEHNAVIKKELKQNLKAKLEIAELVQTFVEFNSDRIKDWNTKTREILDLQKRWEAAGGLPREKAREINKKFWSSFKAYFNKKNDFFRKLEGQRAENLKLKEELVTQANELKESTDWEETAQKFKDLQQKWKGIGPVPEKVRNEIYSKFKASCDYFFNQKREQSKTGSKEYEANLEKKKTIIKEIKKLGKEEKNVKKLKDLQEKFYEVGYVPRSEVSSIKNEFNDTLNEFLDKADNIDETEKDAILLENKVEKLKHSPNADKKLYQKEQSLRKQINKIENDVSIWKNNIEFFANTKNAEKLKEEFRKKIEDASQELEHLKQELRVYASA